MSEANRIEEEELHAFIDGELDAARHAHIEAALAQDSVLARRVAQFGADKQRMAAIFGPLAARPVPHAWTRRIESAAKARRSRITPWMMALAASIALILAGAGLRQVLHPADTILAEASAAHDGGMPPDEELAGAHLPAEAARNGLLQSTLGMPVRAPDLGRFGYRLVALDIFHRHFGSPAAGLVYRSLQGPALTIYVRRSSGTPRFDLLRRGKLRVCVWQDDVVGAVITGEMGAGEMMRIASRAYADLNL